MASDKTNPLVTCHVSPVTFAMGKKQRERKEKKLAQRPHGIAPSQRAADDTFAGPISPQAQLVLNRMADPRDIPEERAIQWIMDSAALRDEEEFWDFHLDDAATLRALNRVMPRYEARLERAIRISKEEAQEEFDEARIEMVKLVFTHALRRDFLERFDRMLKRMLAGTETDKLAMALYVRALLDEKDLPWGIFGLVTQIFGESQERAMAPMDLIEDLSDELTQALGGEEGAQEWGRLLKDKASANKFWQAVESNPELVEKIQEHFDEMLDEFEGEIAEGVYDFEVIPLDEAAHLLATIVQENMESGIDPETADQDAMYERTTEFIAAALQDKLTPDRLDEIENVLRAKLDEWERTRHPRTHALRLEIEELHNEPVAENLFLEALYRGALLKLTHQLQQVAAQMEQSEHPIPSSPPDLADRVRSTFKRVNQ